MKFKELATYLEKLESTASRNEITEILAELFKKADKKEKLEKEKLDTKTKRCVWV